MKFRNYCIVVMGDMGDIRNHIIKISEDKPRYIDAKGILIATFASVANPLELNEYFKEDGRSFFIFDLNEDNSAYHMDNEKLNTHLFSYLEKSDVNLNEMTKKLIDNISESVKVDSNSNTNTVDVETMTKKEIEHHVNMLLDKGIDNLTSEDRYILKQISTLK